MGAMPFGNQTNVKTNTFHSGKHENIPITLVYYDNKIKVFYFEYPMNCVDGAG